MSRRGSRGTGIKASLHIESVMGGLSQVPNRMTGNPDLRAKWVSRSHYTDVKCPSCGGPFWVNRYYVELLQGHANRKCCRDCRKSSRLEGVKAALAVALRKKKMGIRW